MMYSLAGVPFAFHSENTVRQRFTQELERGYRVASASTCHAQEAACPVLRVRNAPEPLNQASIASRTISYPQGQGELTADGFALHTRNERLEISLRPQLAVTLNLQDAQAEQAHIAFGYALQSVLRYRGRFTAHAAAVIEPQTHVGVMLLGASGSGKTTTALQLVRQGWRYLSDDLLLLGATAQGITAWGLRRVFAATDKTLSACDYTGAQRPAGVVEADKLAFDPQTLFPAQYAESCLPQHLLFVEIGDQAVSTWQPLTPRATLHSLLPQSQWACFDTATTHQHLDLLHTLSQQVQGWRLIVGREWMEQPDRAAARLAAHLQQARKPAD